MKIIELVYTSISFNAIDCTTINNSEIMTIRFSTLLRLIRQTCHNELLYYQTKHAQVLLSAV